MAEEFGRIQGNMVISDSFKLLGVVTGNVTVVDGGEFILNGMIGGDLIIQGGYARVDGTVEGNVINQGGRLEIYGKVAGFVRTESGKTDIDPNAVIEKGISSSAPTMLNSGSVYLIATGA